MNAQNAHWAGVSLVLLGSIAALAVSSSVGFAQEDWGYCCVPGSTTCLQNTEDACLDPSLRGAFSYDLATCNAACSFLQPELLCGDGNIDPGEQCDCGDGSVTPEDPLCFPDSGGEPFSNGNDFGPCSSSCTLQSTCAACGGYDDASSCEQNGQCEWDPGLLGFLGDIVGKPNDDCKPIMQCNDEEKGFCCDKIKSGAADKSMEMMPIFTRTDCPDTFQPHVLKREDGSEETRQDAVEACREMKFCCDVVGQDVWMETPQRACGDAVRVPYHGWYGGGNKPESFHTFFIQCINIRACCRGDHVDSYVPDGNTACPSGTDSVDISKMVGDERVYDPNTCASPPVLCLSPKFTDFVKIGDFEAQKQKRSYYLNDTRAKECGWMTIPYDSRFYSTYGDRLTPK